jgi:hypothetical protein
MKATGKELFSATIIESLGRGRGEGGRNDPNIVCTYEQKKKKCVGS